MPGDSSYILYPDSTASQGYILTPEGDTIFFKQNNIPGEAYSVVVSPVKKEESGGNTDTVLTIVILFVLVVLAVRYGGSREDEAVDEALLTPKMRQKRAMEKALENGPVYDSWLSQYNPYYKNLSPPLRERFLLRTIEFAQAKEFRFHALAEEDYMLILLSGAAVQLTFGLRNYLLDFFQVIHVIKREYTLEIDKETYYGHVSKSGIYISWSHFLEGYSDYTDSVNVGLHEMAHAVSYDVFLGIQDRHDRGFIRRLQEFREEGTPLFRALKAKASHVLDDYAATNFDEFWAVCIETFFENPVEFRDTMPGLYQCICDILNQDPTRPGIILDPELAGIAS